MEEPQEITDRRCRSNLMSDIECIAKAKTQSALENPELIDGFFDSVGDDCFPYRHGAMSKEELAATRRLCEAIQHFLAEARLRIAPKPLYGEALFTLGWLEKVQPFASDAFRIFMLRGGLDEGLWSSTR